MTIKLLSLFFIIPFFSCDNSEGLFGHSETKAEAKAKGSRVIEYLPNKTNFKLLDGTEMQIDTAWTEVSFTYHNGKEVLDSNYGYNFSIPFKKQIKGSFTFSFSLADKKNQIFTNGMGEVNTQLCPRILYDTMKVILDQKDTDTSKGWTNPIITDTIIFKRIN